LKMDNVNVIFGVIVVGGIIALCLNFFYNIYKQRKIRRELDNLLDEFSN